MVSYSISSFLVLLVGEEMDVAHVCVCVSAELLNIGSSSVGGAAERSGVNGQVSDQQTG